MMDSGTVNFIRMDEGTYEEYQLLETIYKKHETALPDTVLGALNRLSGDKVGSSRVDLQACKLEYSIVSPK